MADHPENLQPFIEALGEDTSCRLFLKLGGTQVYLPKHTRKGSLLDQAIGIEKSDALAKQIGHGHLRIPIARKWCARHLHAKGHSLAEIARQVHAKDDTIRDWCGPPKSCDQLSLFDKTG